MKQAKIKVEDEDKVEDIFKKYVKICNKAIATHQDDFPYKQIMSLHESLVGDYQIDLAIYDDKPKAAFTLRFKDKKLTTDSHPADPKKAWRMNLSYLEKVVEHPQEYIDHPEKLDLDWLKSKVGF